MRRTVTVVIDGISISEKEKGMLEKCIGIYIGKHTPVQQYAATIAIKMILKEKHSELLNALKDVTGCKVNNRGDGKVCAWEKKVKRTGKCEICGSTEKLEAHHIIPWEYSISGRTDVKNGQCLCESCHKMIHNDYKWIEYKRGGV